MACCFTVMKESSNIRKKRTLWYNTYESVSHSREHECWTSLHVLLPRYSIHMVCFKWTLTWNLLVFVVATESIDPFITFLILCVFLRSSWQAKLYSKTARPPRVYVLFILRRVFLPVLNWQIDHYWTIGNQKRHSVLWHTLRGISQSYNLNETYADGDRKMPFHCAVACVIVCVYYNKASKDVSLQKAPGRRPKVQS